MKCEAELCIYNRENRCVCDSVDVNSLGMCDGYTIITLDHHFLEAEKLRQSMKIEED